MRLSAYWLANFIFDFIKFEITICTTLALFHFFDLGYDSSWATYLAFPFGILPFTYVMSFAFTVDSAA